MYKSEDCLNLTKHIGKWVAIIDGKVKFSGNSAKDVFDKVKEAYPEQEPFIMQVPKNEATLLESGDKN